MEVQINYYKLSFDKEMGDGNKIPQNQELILIRKDEVDGKLFFETHNDDYKKLFWANENEVEFVQTLNEDWSEEKIFERNHYINGDFF
jgi:hypothetical protein